MKNITEEKLMSILKGPGLNYINIISNEKGMKNDLNGLLDEYCKTVIKEKELREQIILVSSVINDTRRN